jgi:hypothetical protein
VQDTGVRDETRKSSERNRIRRREPKNERSKDTRSRHVEELLHLGKRGKAATVSEDGTEDCSLDWKL